MQWYMVCNLPSVYTPHDLQHLAYPQYFTQTDFLSREVLFPAGCRFSHTVVVGTQWVKEDVTRRYRVDPAKIQVIPWAPPTLFYKEPRAVDLTAVRNKYQLEVPFGLYPANLWPHKNHEKLLEALARVRQKHDAVRLVCTGSLLQPFWPKIQSRIHELGLEQHVRFLGFVSDAELRCLYRLAQFLVMPTLYEADSNPIHEAWSEDVPVASSNIPPLVEQVHDAALLFDPHDVDAIADAVARIATDQQLRDHLRKRGRRRAADFSWELTAKAYRAVYRRAANVPLTQEDQRLLEWNWMLDPNRHVLSSAGEDLGSAI
jgi:glycosyltransferase involved in cell wall biosynthesis